MSIDAEILTQVKNLLMDQNRGPDIRNAAVFTWRHIIDRYGGQAEDSYFINATQNKALYRRATMLEPIELLYEWKNAGWIEYSPDGLTTLRFCIRWLQGWHPFKCVTIGIMNERK